MVRRHGRLVSLGKPENNLTVACTRTKISFWVVGPGPTPERMLRCRRRCESSRRTHSPTHPPWVGSPKARSTPPGLFFFRTDLIPVRNTRRGVALLYALALRIHSADCVGRAEVVPMRGCARRWQALSLLRCISAVRVRIRGYPQGTARRCESPVCSDGAVWVPGGGRFRGEAAERSIGY